MGSDLKSVHWANQRITNVVSLVKNGKKKKKKKKNLPCVANTFKRDGKCFFLKETKIVLFCGELA